MIVYLSICILFWKLLKSSFEVLVLPEWRDYLKLSGHCFASKHVNSTYYRYGESLLLKYARDNLKSMWVNLIFNQEYECLYKNKFWIGINRYYI